MTTSDLDEGSCCPGCGEGYLELKPVDNGSCHPHAPCHDHAEQGLWCPTCGWEPGDE
jgi:hypothetical protein